MNNQNKWGRELLYSIIFCATAFIWFFYNPLAEIRDIIDLSPNALDIKYKLFNWGIYPIFYGIASITKFGLMFFLLCAMYTGILSLKKAPTDGKRIIFGLIPKSVPGFLALAVVFISSLWIILFSFTVGFI